MTAGLGSEEEGVPKSSRSKRGQRQSRVSRVSVGSVDRDSIRFEGSWAKRTSHTRSS